MPSPRAVMEAEMSEKELQQWVIDLAKRTGWRVYFTWNSRHSPKGWVDLILLRGIYMLCLELKTEKGRVKLEQAETIRALSVIRRVEVDVIRPRHRDQLEKILTAKTR